MASTMHARAVASVLTCILGSLNMRSAYANNHMGVMQMPILICSVNWCSHTAAISDCSHLSLSVPSVDAAKHRIMLPGVMLRSSAGASSVRSMTSAVRSMTTRRFLARPRDVSVWLARLVVMFENNAGLCGCFVELSGNILVVPHNMSCFLCSCLDMCDANT